MERYDSYKDSGVEWVGDIPSKWEWLKIKNLFSFSKGSGISKSDIEEDGTSKCILYGELFTRFKDFNVIPNEFSKTNLEDKIVSEGDELLIPGSTTTTSVDLCNCKTLNHKGIQLGGDIIILKPRRNDIYNEFYSYYISTVTKPDFETGGRGVTIHHIYPKQIREIHIPNIPLSEQQQIVSFLDTKTSLIDSLIEKTQLKIELLKEKRTTLINEVVTKGLNHNVEMKDSGVEWIGEIPSHWEITKMKYGVNHLSEKGKPEKSDIKISPENVESDTGVCFNLYSEHESEGMRFQSGDILLNKLRLYLKKILYTEYDGFSLGEMIVLRTNKKLNNKYFYQLLFSQGLIDLLDSQSTGVKLPRVSPDVILNTEIVYPPLNEQQQIIEYLDEQTGLIDKTISIEEKRIELLKEYRQSLISEVVTGKRKVV